MKKYLNLYIEIVEFQISDVLYNSTDERVYDDVIIRDVYND